MIKKLYNQYLEEEAIHNKLYKEYQDSRDRSIYDQMCEQEKKVKRTRRELYEALYGKIFEIEEGRFIQVEPDEYCEYDVIILEQLKE